LLSVVRALVSMQATLKRLLYFFLPAEHSAVAVGSYHAL